MKDYEKPHIEVMYFKQNDIITSSMGVFDEENGEFINKDMNWEE